MSDRAEVPPGEDPGSRIFRASLPGWISGLHRRQDGPSELFAPGRAWLELAGVAAALAILLPVAAPGAVLSGVMARRAGNARGLALVLLGLWCGVLGCAVRGALGMGVVP